NLLAGRPLVVGPGRGGLGGYLLAWTVPLSFCSGLCGLAVSPAFEVAVPRWSILGYGAACALLALLAPLLRGPRAGNGRSPAARPGEYLRRAFGTADEPVPGIPE